MKRDSVLDLFHRFVLCWRDSIFRFFFKIYFSDFLGSLQPLIATPENPQILVILCENESVRSDPRFTIFTNSIGRLQQKWSRSGAEVGQIFYTPAAAKFIMRRRENQRTTTCLETRRPPWGPQTEKSSPSNTKQIGETSRALNLFSYGVISYIVKTVREGFPAIPT